MKAIRFARAPHTSRPRTHASRLPSTHDFIRKSSKPIKITLAKPNERETMRPGRGSSLTAAQSQYPGTDVDWRGKPKARSNTKYHYAAVERQVTPTTTEEYFKSIEWLNSVTELSIKFVAHDGRESTFDHIMMRHDRFPRGILLPTLLMR